MTASMLRILITHWVGKAWFRLTTEPEYDDTFRKSFERTGALITADGSLDDLIKSMKVFLIIKFLKL